MISSQSHALTTRMVKYLTAAVDKEVMGLLNVPRKRKRRERFSHPKRQCLGARILDEIERRGGMTALQIRKQLFEWSYPDQTYDRAKRGWWSSPLYGGVRSKHGRGLLRTFCVKNGRRWVRNSRPHDDRPFVVISTVSKSKWHSAWKPTWSPIIPLPIPHSDPLHYYMPHKP
jgi:hypothetical protein